MALYQSSHLLFPQNILELTQTQKNTMYSLFRAPREGTAAKLAQFMTPSTYLKKMFQMALLLLTDNNSAKLF